MKISVVIPTFNRRHQLGRAITSVLSQEGVDIELVIVDDGSTDGTIEWIAQEFPDPRVRVLKNARSKGPAGARNSGILAATGDLIAFLDSDDSYLPLHLKECQEVFSRFPEVGVVFGKALYEQNGQPVDYMGPNFELKLAQASTTYTDTALKVFDAEFFTHLLRYGCYFNLSTIVLRAQAAQALMNEGLRIAEDYEFWARLSRSHRFVCLSRPQISYLLHDQNISFEEADSAADNAPKLLKAYQILLDYEGLRPDQSALIREHMAEILFNWGYRCRKHKQLLEACRLHLRSSGFGKRKANLLALLKLMLVGLFPGLEPRGR